MIFGKWILVLILTMLAKEPGSVPWLDMLPVEAEAIADEASARPLPGMTPGLTAALDVVMAWHESRFNPEAVHDHGAGYGLFGTHGATLGRDVPFEVPGQVSAWHELARMSFKICADRPREDRLAWYASGDATCEKRAGLSRARIWEAVRLLRDYPPFAP